MPFSIVAVLLLVLSGISVAALYQDAPEGPRPMSPETVQALKGISVQACEDIARTAYSAALDAVGGMSSLNETALQAAFLEALSSRLQASYPQERAGGVVTVGTTDLALTVLHASVDGGSSVPAYLSLRGNFSVNVSRPDGHLVRVQEMDGSLYVPLPLLLDRLSRLEAASDVRGSIEATVRYELAVLAQDRVLRGFGAEERDGGTGTAAIITDQDVLRAVNLALLLEEMRLFRSSPQPDLEDLLGGEVDAAELFLRTYEDGEYDLRFIAAQAVNGMLDRIVLGLLESLGFLNPVALYDDTVSGIAWGINEVIDWACGSDVFAEGMVDDLKRRAAEAGHEEVRYNWFGGSYMDGFVVLEPYVLSFCDAAGEEHQITLGGAYNVDFPLVDVFASPLWEEFFDGRLVELDLMAEHLRQFVRTVADQIALYASLPVLRASPDPTDGRSWTAELGERLRSAFEAGEDWTAPALEAVREAGRIQDAMSLATLDFIRTQWQNLTGRHDAVRNAVLDLSQRLAWEVNGTVPMDEKAMEALKLSVRISMYDPCWNAERAIAASFDGKAAPFLQAMEAALARGAGERDLVGEAVSMLAGRVAGPSLQPLASRSVLDVIEQVERTFSARNEGAPILLPEEGFLLHGPGGADLRERLEVEDGALVPGDGGAGTLRVEVARPWEQVQEGTNLHLTDLTRSRDLPYTSQWSVAYHGTAVVRASAPAAGGGAAPVELDIPLEGCFNVVTTSGWGLVGVEYLPTVTLDRAIADLLVNIWDGLLVAAEALGKAIAEAFDLFAQVVSAVLSYALDPIGAMADALMDIAAWLSSMTDGFVSTVLGAFADLAGSIAGGTEVHLSLFGLTLALFIEPGDSSLPGAVDRLRMDARMELVGVVFSGSLRLLRMPEGDHTVVADAAVGKGDWRMELTVDPRTRVYDHVVHAAGYFGGMVLDVVLPLVEAVNKVRLSLSDIPLLGQALQNLPCFPGTKLAVDAGVEIGIVTSLSPTLTVNEVEMNPPGRDGGREWVELYNPTGRVIDLSGWSLVTSHGSTSSFPLPAKLIAPGENFVYTFPRQALDNGGEAFPREESVVLKDPAGERVDSGPWATDHADDGRTWQRDHDASSRWVFKEGTPGRANGLPYRSGDLDGLLGILASSFQDAFAELPAVSDLDDLGELIKRAVRLAAERVIVAVTGAISYLKLFVQAGVGDTAGVVEGGINAALLVTGETVRECLLSLLDNVCALINDPLNPGNLLRLFEPLGQVGPEDLFVQLAGYLSLSVPRGILGSASDKLCQAEVSVRTNLALARVLGGEDRDDWAIEFGVHLSAGADLLKAGPAGGRGELGVWLMHCTLRPA